MSLWKGRRLLQDLQDSLRAWTLNVILPVGLVVELWKDVARLQELNEKKPKLSIGPKPSAIDQVLMVKPECHKHLMEEKPNTYKNTLFWCLTQSFLFRFVVFFTGTGELYK